MISRSGSYLLLAAASCAVAISGCSRDKPAGQPAVSVGSQPDSARLGDTALSHNRRVTLTEAASRTATIVVEPVQSTSAQTESPGLEVPGQIEFDPRRVALVSPRAAGRLERLLVVEGDRVRAGQVVAELYSPAFIMAQQDFLQAVRRSVAVTTGPDADGAKAVARAARQRLSLLGVDDSVIAAMEAAGELRAQLLLTAPLSGSVLESHVLPGATVDIGTAVFKIADLSDVDAIAAVPERALPDVRIGQRAWVRIVAYPGLEFEGQVERLSDELDAETRTVKAAIHVPNRGGRLRPGMFATVRLALPLGDAVRSGASSSILTIPESAVLADPEGRFVFVEVAPQTFEQRKVRVGSLAPPGSASSTSDRLLVREGLRAGERVVVQGAFTLKSELAKAALEEEH